MNAGIRCGLLLCIALLAAPVAAQGPSYDCAQAEGTVEKLICRDAALAARDRQLNAVYRAAIAKARDKPAVQLRAEQRGWIKGRNDCWKANGQPIWITASWTENTVPGCVAAQYRLRTAELQAVWQLLPASTVTYACQDNPANELVAGFHASDPPTVRIERGDRTRILWQVGPVEAGWHEGQNVSLVRQGDGVKVSWLDTNTGQTEALACKVR